jgi:ABC-type amino acid transport substrate-binding protein
MNVRYSREPILFVRSLKLLTNGALCYDERKRFGGGKTMSGLLVRGLLVFTHSEAEIGVAAEQEKIFNLAHIENFEPFTVAKEGKSEGLAIDIVAEALARVNLKVLFVGKHQDELDDLLLKGQVDGLAFLGINPERRKTYDFSEPYLISGGALFVKSPNPPSFDLKAFEGKTVATPQKGPLAGYIEKKFPKVKALTDVKNYMETLQAVVDGKAEAAALNTQSGSSLARRRFPGKFSLPEKGFLEVPIGIGVLRGKQGYLLTKFNEGLKKVISDGTYDKLVKKWGVPPATKPEKR